MSVAGTDKCLSPLLLGFPAGLFVVHTALAYHTNRFEAEAHADA